VSANYSCHRAALPDADNPFLLKALEHYADFLAATNRDGRPYRDIIAKLQQPQQPERKAPVSEMPRVPRKRRAQT
jgi:hypothetical protein